MTDPFSPEKLVLPYNDQTQLTDISFTRYYDVVTPERVRELATRYHDLRAALQAGKQT